MIVFINEYLRSISIKKRPFDAIETTLFVFNPSLKGTIKLSVVHFNLFGFLESRVRRKLFTVTNHIRELFC